MAHALKAWELNCNDVQMIADNSVGLLGCGPQSMVHLAQHRVYGLVAIKCFMFTGGPPERSMLETEIQNEMQLLQQAANDYVARVYGYVKWSNYIGLVMEYLPAGSLRQFTQTHSVRLSPKVILRISFDTSTVLACMHNLPNQMRMIHGDIKPENVLVTSELHCKLCDFGSARLVTLTGFPSPEAKTCRNPGMTMAYAAPEKLKNPNINVEKEQDTYSFGMLLYVLLTRTTPYQNQSQECLYLESVKNGQRPVTTEISKMKDSLGSEDKLIITTLELIMMNCWQQKPNLRPTMLQVRDELQKLLDHQNRSDMISELAEATKKLTITLPKPKKHELVPLQSFLPKFGNSLQDEINIHSTMKSMIRNDARKSGDQGSVNSPPTFLKTGRSDQAVEIKPTNSTQKKPKLDQVFNSPDIPGLPNNVRTAPNFLGKYKIALKNQKYEEAKTMTTAITSMIEDNIDATAKDVKEFGIKLREKNLFLESIAVFDAASAMFEKMGKTEENLKRMTYCVGEMKITNEAMTGDDAINIKVIVENYVIPLMREKLRHIEDTSLVSEQFKCLQVCWVLHFIEYSEYLVDELEKREKNLRLALTRMKDVLKADVIKFQVFGHLLNNLGNVCERTSRFDEAASFYSQARDAKKAATDFNDEEGKKRAIDVSAINLKIVQLKI